jgi:endonuclease YncB( thermonuclease family)
MGPRRSFAFVFVVATAVLAGPADARCDLPTMRTGTVAAVRDGRTLLLSDRREMRLAAIEVAGNSRAALEKLTAGQTLRLERLGPGRDRYGRLVGFAFAGGSEQSLQQVLIEAGLAWVSARSGGKACAEGLFSAEAKARTDKRGLWADPNFAPLPAENVPLLETKRGQFALVEGKVVSVRESGSTIYVNFNQQWWRGFSISIRRRLQRSFTAAGVELKKLEGRRIRVRGWIEQRQGPAIEVEVPEQIELVDFKSE